MKIKGEILAGPQNVSELGGKFKVSFKVGDDWYAHIGDKEKLEKLILDGQLMTGNIIEFEHTHLVVTGEISIIEKKKAPEKRSSDMITISGKDYMQYKGLLNLAHGKNENFNMEITESYVSEDMKRAWCKVRLTAGDRIFDGFGSSTPENTGVMTKQHPVEMAHTRAKGRALRDYLNIGEAMAEELAKPK